MIALLGPHLGGSGLVPRALGTPVMAPLDDRDLSVPEPADAEAPEDRPAESQDDRQEADLLPVLAGEGEQSSEPDETFWSLAKNGTAAWGHEPSVEEISGYWQDLLAEARHDAEQRGSEILAQPGEAGWDEQGIYYEDELYGEDGLYYTDDVYGDEWVQSRPERSPWEPPDVVDWPLLPASDQVPPTEQLFAWWDAPANQPGDEEAQAGSPVGAGVDDELQAWFGPDPTPEVVGWLGLPLRAPDPEHLHGHTTGRRVEPEPWEPPRVVDWLPLRSDVEASQAKPKLEWLEAPGGVALGVDVGEDVRSPDAPFSGPGISDARRSDPWSGPDPTPEAVGWLSVSPRAAAPGSDSKSEAGAFDVEVTQLVGLASGGLAYAGALGMLERRRRVQVGRRRSGEAVPLPAAPLDAYERELRQGTDVEAANLVDVALRAAAAGAGSTGLPRLALVEAGPDQVRVAVPTSRQEPVPEGFNLLGPESGYGWETAACLADLASLAAPALAPMPAVVPLGVTHEGAELLVDLEAVGVVSIDGPLSKVLGLLRSAALVLATAAWSEGVRLVVVGFERELQDLPDVVHVGTLQEALTMAERHTERVAAALEAQGHSHTGAARGALASNEAHDLVAVVSALPPQDEETWQRVMALSSYRRRGVGLLVPNLVPVGVKMAEVGRLDAERGTLRVPGVLATRQLTPRRLDAVDLRGLIGLLASATRREGTGPSFDLPSRGGASGVSAARPEEALPTGVQVRAQAPVDGEVLVRVLGPVVAVRAVDGSEHLLEPATPGALELLAYLALRGSPVTDGTIEVNLLPDGAGSVKVGDLVDEARRLLGPDVVYRWAAGRFALSERVFTDYSCFCDRVAQAEVSPDPDDAVELLTAALKLVTSTPLNGVGQSYPWAGTQRMVMTAQVLDAADALAELRAEEHEWLALEWAAYQGLRVAPADERMHQWLMRAAQARGDIDRIHELFADLCDLVADPVIGIEPEDTVQPETMQLMEELLSQAPPPARRGLPSSPGVAVTTELPQVGDEELPVTREVPRIGPDDEARAGLKPVSLLRQP